MIALASAPAIVSIITQFFLPIQNGRIACSAVYPNISINCGIGNPAFYHWSKELRND